MNYTIFMFIRSNFSLVTEPSDGEGWRMGGGGGVDATPEGFFSRFSREQGELLFQTKFLPVGTSLGYLSMKKIFRLELLSWP